MPSLEFLPWKKIQPLLISSALLSLTACAVMGPSSSATSYLTPLAPGVEFTAILTAGDSLNKNPQGIPYRMAGIPDGLGVYDNGDATITVLMNHELRATVGVTRAHGGKGAFVSKWQIRKSDLKVLHGEDLIQTVHLWNGERFIATEKVTFDRFCSANLAPPSAFFNTRTGKGYNAGRIFMNGEETANGRAFAHLILGPEHGTTFEFVPLGKASWENVVANPAEQDTTIVAGMEDGELNASKVYFYIGEKKQEGSPLDKAGLTHGATYALSIDGFRIEGGTAAIPQGYVGPFSLVPTGGTGLNRVEDGAWDTIDARRFYFATTANFEGNSRLWRLTFHDLANPLAGGTIEVLVDGLIDGPKMMDNLTVDGAGKVYIQEDVGNQAHLGKIWKYTPATDTLQVLAQHDAERFIAGAPADIDGSGAAQSNEESSGIVEVTELFTGVKGYNTAANRYFLLTVQAHYTHVNHIPVETELVAGGQLLMMKVPK